MYVCMCIYVCVYISNISRYQVSKDPDFWRKYQGIDISIIYQEFHDFFHESNCSVAVLTLKSGQTVPTYLSLSVG